MPLLICWSAVQVMCVVVEVCQRGHVFPKSWHGSVMRCVLPSVQCVFVTQSNNQCKLQLTSAASQHQSCPILCIPRVVRISGVRLSEVTNENHSFGKYTVSCCTSEGALLCGTHLEGQESQVIPPARKLLH